MRILYGVLHWGLGHATRSAALIKQLQAEGHELILASNGASADWLRMEFPDLDVEELPDYAISYPKSGSYLWHFLGKAPRLFRSYRKERKSMGQLIRKHRPHRIISDNRPGFYHHSAYNIYLTSQLRVKSGWATPITSYCHRMVMRFFQEVWVPDHPHFPGLGGVLTHAPCPRPIRYVGPLSAHASPTGSEEITWEVCAVLSGPEPHRSLLEEKLHLQLNQLGKRSLIIAGSAAPSTSSTETVEVRGLCSAADVARAISSARCVVTRSGYSTLMDLENHTVPALLVPTPGQAEQEYLGQLHFGKYAVSTQPQLNVPEWYEDLFGLAEGDAKS